MSYDLSAEGDNGVKDRTRVAALSGFDDRDGDLTAAKDSRDYNIVLEVQAEGSTDSATAIRGSGANAGPGIVGAGGKNGGVGVVGAGGKSGRALAGAGVVGLSGPALANTGPGGESPLGVGVLGAASVGVKVKEVAVGVLGRVDYGMGVLGVSEKEGDGVRGVVGVGFEGKLERRAGVRGVNSVRTDERNQKNGTGPGVLGESAQDVGVIGGSGMSHGVEGETDATDAAGVHGVAKEGLGGLFEGGRSPLRLVPAAQAGPPKSGKHEVGEFWVDKKGMLYFCTESSSAANAQGVWKLLTP